MKDSREGSDRLNQKPLMYKSYSSGSKLAQEGSGVATRAFKAKGWFVALMMASLFLTIIVYLFFRKWELDLIVAIQPSMIGSSIRNFQIISDSKSFISLGVPIIILLIGYWRKDRPLKLAAVFILISIGISGIFSLTLKKTLKEPRPYEMDARIVQYSGGGGYGFPSGHVIEAAAAAAGIAIVFSNTVVSIISFTWVLLIMMSRIYLGVHDIDQVLGGLFLGLCCPILLIKLANFLPERLAREITPEFPKRATT